jgi:septum formation protein
MPTPHRLILASASEGRRYLLSRAGWVFEVQPSGVDEPPFAGFPSPRSFVQHVAWLKAAAVAERSAAGLILAADSIAWHEGEVIGKPADRDDARRILLKLAGTTHELWTGACLWRRPDDWQICFQEASTVEMRTWTTAELNAYLDSGIWEGKSGAYGIQEQGDPYVRIVRGSVSNVIGLPMETLSGVLASLGLPPPGGPFSAF